MSTPPFLALPESARSVTLATSRGPLAGIGIEPSAASRGVVVMVPGFTGSKEDFIAVLEPLAVRGWAVVAYDQRGQYESSGPDDEGAYTLGALAEDLLDVIEGISHSPVHVVGHSFGGLVAREAALTSGGARFASLTLLCSGPGSLPPSHHDGLGAMRSALPHVPLGTIYDVKESADREGGWAPPSAEIEEFMRRRFVTTNAWALRAKAGILVDTPDRTDELAALAADGLPVAIVYGPHDDAWTTAEQDRVASALGTTAVVVPGTGHSPAAEDPEAAAEALDVVLSGFAATDAG